MVTINDSELESQGKLEIVRKVGKRRITHVIHDIDGTHSLIRDWPPVMSLSIYHAMTCGLSEDFDSAATVKRLIEQTGARPLPETDRFCVESAGLSAITQMEFGIRRAIQDKCVPGEILGLLTDGNLKINAEIIRRIWNGEERFDDLHEPEALTAFINERTPRLFRLYEAVLNGACRDRNTADAWKNPDKWQVPGALSFMGYLHDIGLVNYFVTGAVIYPEGGMYEEVKSLRFEIGPGKMVEGIEGSAWDRKMPKDEVMKELFTRLKVSPENALVVGDGRTEIKAGAELGCVVMSRLPRNAARLRELHRELGAHYIVEDYVDSVLRRLIVGSDSR